MNGQGADGGLSSAAVAHALAGKTHSSEVPRDVLIIGAGPAGLVAANYLGRYRRRVWLVDSGDSRAARIPRSWNIPGFPDGVCGTTLLERMRRQAEAAGVVVTAARIESLRQVGSTFEACSADGACFAASKVVLATGLKDALTVPGVPEEILWNTSVRWCPVCDGHESMDQRIVLITEPGHAVARGRFLRTYTRELTVVLASPSVPQQHAAEALRALQELGIETVEGAPLRVDFFPAGGGVLCQQNGEVLPFDVLYAMGGASAHSELAQELGAHCRADGSLEVDRRQMTSVEGLYAVGDVVAGLHQVGVAMGQAAVAATAIHAALPFAPR